MFLKRKTLQFILKETQKKNGNGETKKSKKKAKQKRKTWKVFSLKADENQTKQETVEDKRFCLFYLSVMLLT